jgi:hypothetical protein
MVLPLLAILAFVILYLAVVHWYITIPVIIIVVWYFFFYSPKDSDKKTQEDYQSRREQSSSYQSNSGNDYSSYNSNAYSRQPFEEKSYEEKSYKKKSYKYSDNTSEKKKFGRVRMARINARLEKFQITPEDAQIIFGSTWKSKLGKPEWEFYYVVRMLEIKIQYDYRNYYRKKFGRLYSKVLQIIQIVIDENPEMRQAEEQFEQQGYWDNFEDESYDYKYYESSEFTEEDIAEAFEIFGLSSISTKDQIKSKYRELTLKHHPDKNKSVDSNTKMAEINNAYEIIMGAIA